MPEMSGPALGIADDLHSATSGPFGLKCTPCAEPLCWSSQSRWYWHFLGRPRGKPPERQTIRGWTRGCSTWPTPAERMKRQRTRYTRFKRAVKLGANMLELDVQSTKDDQLVVIHNATVDQTTDGTGKVRDLTFVQVLKLDAAYNSIPGRHAVPGEPPESYPLRGVRTGDKEPPP